jgi:hypothetical protein
MIMGSKVGMLVRKKLVATRRTPGRLENDKGLILSLAFKRMVAGNQNPAGWWGARRRLLGDECPAMAPTLFRSAVANIF